MSEPLVLVGGGLANALIAHRILRDDPDHPLLVVERGATLGGRHTWSFHDTDLSPAQLDWIEPLVAHAWSCHELRFPTRRRQLATGYRSVTSDRLHEVVGLELGGRRLRLGAEVEDVAPDRVRLAGGEVIRARAVIDGRGDPGSSHLEVAFQKFVGLFVRLETPHDLAGPVLMDATVEQFDGYRFVYTLPLGERELLVEDTFYSDSPSLDVERLRAGIRLYAARQGWSVAEVVGEEAGVLPIVLDGDIEAVWAEGPAGVARSGMRAVLFHPTTGYSLPEAVRLADAVAARRELDGAGLYRLTHDRSVELWRRGAFFRLLNRMLYRAAEPSRRVVVFERFYGLSEGLIRRFYSGRLKWTDKARLLTGRPPVPIRRALRCLAPIRRPVVERNVEGSEGGT
ncbi:MAG TPA: lycopene beta-cyclase CrtY [Methylomirabilota bacterium]|nr:lycopene beta-cyclase CrtY [Methylomirabilota bacterium]